MYYDYLNFIDADRLNGYKSCKLPKPNCIPVSDENGKIDKGFIPTCEKSSPHCIPISDENGKIDKNYIPTCVEPTPNCIPISDETGKISNKWLQLPDKGLIYTAYSKITASSVGHPITYTFDFTDWYNDYKKIKNDIQPSDFLVIPIVTFSIFRIANPNPQHESNGPPSLGDYFYVDYNSSAPTYLDGTGYKFILNLGSTGTSSDGGTHPYSTKGYAGFIINFLGGPKGVLFKYYGEVTNV